MKKQTSSPDAVMAAFIDKCAAHLEQETNRLGRWPDRLRLPEPRDDIERQALELWIREIKEATGRAILLESAGQPAAEGEAASEAVFVNLKTGATVVLDFVFLYGWWHIYQRTDAGTPRNWSVTVGRRFQSEDEGREFLRSRGWSEQVPASGR
jgi:hypothetical protein